MSEVSEIYVPKLVLPNRGNGLYKPEDISFVNTAELTKVGKHFMKTWAKNGMTCRLSPHWSHHGSPLLQKEHPSLTIATIGQSEAPLAATIQRWIITTDY